MKQQHVARLCNAHSEKCIERAEDAVHGGGNCEHLTLNCELWFVFLAQTQMALLMSTMQVPDA